MPTDEEIKAAVTHALSQRGAEATAVESATLAQLVKHQQSSPIGGGPLDQVAGKLTDLFVEGRRNMPPNNYRPQLSAFARSECEKFGANVPDAVIDALVSFAIGWMIDQGRPVLPGARPVVMHQVVGLYLSGA